MGHSNSKQKGGNFERKIAKKLSLWYSDGEDENVFYRTQSSGARGKMASGNLENQYSDIMTLKPEGFSLIDIFVVECKFYQNFDVLTILEGNTNSTFKKFLEEVFEDAVQAEQSTEKKKYPMLIAKRNRRSEIVAFPEEFLNKMNQYDNDFAKNKHLRLNNLNINECDVQSIIIMKLEDFFRLDPSIIKECEL